MASSCHPPTTNWRGQISHHDCQAYHQAHPGEVPRGRRNRQRRGKRARREESPERDAGEESEEAFGEEECEECNEDE